MTDIVEVSGFGPLRGRLPGSVPWRTGTVRDLHERLVEEDPSLAPWMLYAVTIIDGAPSRPDDPVHPGSRIELLPPVSGG